MSDFQMNDHKLAKECDELAQEIFDTMVADDLQPDETPEDHNDTMSDNVHDTVDGHEWVIYYYKAHQICQNCNTDEGAQFLEDVGQPDPVTYDSLATTIAYGEMLARVNSKLAELVTEWEE